MTNKIKFVCPDCGGRLELWEEHVYEERLLINLNGTLGKKRNAYIGNVTGCAGVGCKNCNKSTYMTGDCGFENKELITKILDNLII